MLICLSDNGRRGLGKYRSGIACAAALGMSRMAMAAGDNWTQTAGGNWETPGNWSQNGLPGLTIDATFNTGSGVPYTVSFPGQETVQNLTVQNDSVTFDSTGNTNESLEMYLGMKVLASAGQTTRLALQGTPGGYGIETDNGSFVVGGGAGTTYFTDNSVRLTCDGGGFDFDTGSIVSINATVRAGSAGGGMIVRGIASLSASLLGNVAVGGPGAGGAVFNGSVQAPQAGNLSVGSGGTGTYNGSFDASDGNISVGVDSPGTVNAAGLFGGEIFYIGTAGVPGTLNASGGATVDAMQELYIGSKGIVHINQSSLNFVAISASPSALIDLTNGTLNSIMPNGPLALPETATLEGTGSVNANVSNGGTVVVGDSLSNGILKVTGNFQQSSGAFLDVTLGGTSPGGFGQLDATGAETLGGTLDVTFANGFSPASGDSFPILAFGSESGNFAAVDLPTLPSGLSWNTQNLYTTGTISVVPEPVATGGLCVVGLGMLTRWRRLHNRAQRNPN